MLWQSGRRSENIEDQRGAGAGFGGGGFPIGRAGGVGGLGAVALIILALVFGVDPSVIFQDGGQAPSTNGTSGPVTSSPEEDQLKDFVSVVLASTEDTWQAVFQQEGGQYRDPHLVLYRGAVDSACGMAQSATGPFYCPGDQKVYLDLSFFKEMTERLNAPGEFADAYVVAHEVGHHVQNLLGITARVERYRQRVDRAEANRASVRLELQADCLAGVWANRADKAKPMLEHGDVESALNAASAIGDDRLQRQARGYVVPDSFTHGSSAQRVRWFRTGLERGTIQACDTFNADAV